MGHDVFISYSSEDKPVADAICASLENSGIRCWIAPRDVLPGQSYGGALIQAINTSRVLVLVFSSHANESPHVIKEIERAVSKGLTIIPFRIEDVPLSRDLEYFISSTHWLDAITPPIERNIEKLAGSVGLLFRERPKRTGFTDAQSSYSARGTSEGLAANGHAFGEHVLSGQRTPGEMLTLKGHAGQVNAAAFSPDGRFVISGGNDKTVRVWDIQRSGVEENRLRGHTSWITSLAISQDGDHVLSGAADCVRLWDFASRKEIRQFKRDKFEAEAVSFSPDARWVLAGGCNGTVILWDAENGGELWSYESASHIPGGRGPRIRCVAFAPDGTRALIGSYYPYILEIDFVRSRVDWTIQLVDACVNTPPEFCVTGIAFSPDSVRAASSQTDGSLRLWNLMPNNSRLELKSVGELRRFTGHVGAVNSVVYSSDGNRILSGSDDGTVRLWDVDSGQELFTLPVYSHPVRCVDISQDGRFALSCGVDQIVRLLRLP